MRSLHPGQVHVDEHAPVVGGRKAAYRSPLREVKYARQSEQRVGLHGPEHSAANELDVLPRQHVVRAQVPWTRVGEVRRVKTRVAAMREIRAALESARLDGAGALRRQPRVDQRVVEQWWDCARNAAAVQRVGVLVARYHEQSPRLQTAVHATVVVNVARLPGRDVVRPETNLVEVAAAVAIL